MANRNIRSSKLVELGNSGYEIVADEPDIRNWNVRNAEGKYVGVVSELLVDEQLHKVRYIVLHIEGKPLNLISRKVLIPIGIAELDEIDDVVILPTITIGHLATLPLYKKGKLMPETERKVRGVLASHGIPGDTDDIIDADFYEHDHFSDRNLYKREKKVQQSPDAVNEHAASRDKEELAPFREEAIEITEKSEVPVVTKEARVVEEVVINKNVSERDKKIKDSVRSTEVEIEDLNNEKDL